VGDGACEGGLVGDIRMGNKSWVAVGVSAGVRQGVFGDAKAETTRKCPLAWG